MVILMLRWGSTYIVTINPGPSLGVAEHFNVFKNRRVSPTHMGFIYIVFMQNAVKRSHNTPIDVCMGTSQLEYGGQTNTSEGAGSMQ